MPDPWPHLFGFHEIFHALTVLAFASHFIDVTIATYSLRNWPSQTAETWRSGTAASWF
ncbi:MAG: hypothetical protein ABIU87_13485 [Ornithinibacter sp.]